MFPLVRSRSRSRFFGAASTLNFNFVDGSPFPGQITFTRASGATRFNSSGVLETVGNDVARLDFNPATLEAQGLLIEEQRTNLALRSEEFNNAVWSKPGSTITANSTTAPDGTVTADLMLETAVTTEHILFYTAAQTFTTVTQSFYVKPNGRTNVTLRFFFAINDWVTTVFGLTGNGLITQSSAGSASNFSAVSGAITNVGNGWYRISMTATQPSRSTISCILDLCTTPTPTLDSAGNFPYPGDVTKGVYVWGAQLEVGAFPTSYIPTTTTALTRSADVASVNTLTPWFNAAAGTLYAEAQVSAGIGATPAVMAGLDDTTINNRIQLRRQSPGTIGDGRFVSSGGNWTGTATSGTLTGVNKQAVAYASSNQAGAVNGTLMTGIVSVATIPTITRLALGDGQGSTPLNGYLRRITYYPRRLADAQLQALTA